MSGVPKREENPDWMVVMPVRVSAEMKAALRRRADQEGRSVSELARDAFWRYLTEPRRDG